MPLSNSSFYESFRYNNYDFENLFKAYRELGNNVLENFRQTERNLFVKSLGTYRIVPRQFLNVSGAQYDTQSIKSTLGDVDAKRYENKLSGTMPLSQNQKYYNTWDVLPSDPNLFEFTENGNGECFVSNYVGKTISEIVIPFKSPSGSIVTGVTNAFTNNPTIRKITIPSSVEWLDNGAFKGCAELKNIELSYGIQTIGAESFADCINLNEVDIPSSVLEIGDRAFKNCKKMKRVSLSDNLRALGVEVFASCEQLTEVSIPDTIQVISDYSFYGCRSLKEMNTPLVTSIIGEGAFKNCSGLTNIYLHENLSEIKISAFEGCLSLKEIFLPKSITKIDSLAFASCLSLNKITFEEDGNDNLMIGEGALSATNITAVHFPDRVISIGGYCLQDNHSLLYVKLPVNKNLTFIPEGMFLNCDNLVSINIPESISSLKRLSFVGCTGLNTMLFNTSSNITCFDVNECRNTIELNLIAEYPTIGAEDIDNIINDITVDGKINFENINTGLNSDDEQIKMIYGSIVGIIDSQTPIDKLLFSSSSTLSSIMTRQTDETTYNEIEEYCEFCANDNTYAKPVSFLRSSTDDFSDQWNPQEHNEWSSITSGYYVCNKGATEIETIQYNDLSEVPAQEFVKPILKVYTDSYPLNRSAYNFDDIMSNEELCAILDNTGNYIELSATMGREAISENPVIVSFELYDNNGRLMVEGVDYMLINNRFYLVGEYANASIYNPDMACEMRNIAIDFDTVDQKIGNNLNIEYTNKLSKTEFCEAIKQYTLHALLGPKVSAIRSASSSYDEISKQINIYDRINAPSDIMEIINRRNLTSYDFIITYSESMDYNRLSLFIEYVKAVKPPETNFIIVGVGMHNEIYDGTVDEITNEHHETYNEDYADKRVLGNILHFNNIAETTNTVSYVTYHTGDVINEETIKEELYSDSLTDNLYIISNGERTPLTVIYNDEHTLLSIDGDSV